MGNLGVDYPFYKGGYFMTESDQDATVGRMVREYTETKKKLALLEQEGDRIGKTLQTLGRALEQSPNRVSIDGQSMPIDIPRMGFDSKDLAADRIKKLTDDIRAQMEIISKLEPKLKELGLKL